MGELLFHLQNMCRKAEPCQHHAEDIFVSDIYHNVEHRIMTEVRLWNTRMNPIISPNKLNSLISALNRRFITRWVSDEKIFDSQELFSHFFARFLSVYITMGSLLEVSDMKYVNNISFVHRALSNYFRILRPAYFFFHRVSSPPPCGHASSFFLCCFWCDYEKVRFLIFGRRSTSWIFIYFRSPRPKSGVTDGQGEMLLNGRYSNWQVLQRYVSFLHFVYETLQYLCTWVCLLVVEFLCKGFWPSYLTWKPIFPTLLTLISFRSKIFILKGSFQQQCFLSIYGL